MQSPIPGLILLFSTIGAVVDWRYHRAGGKPSSRNDRLLFGGIVLLLVIVIAAADYSGYNPAILGIVAGDLTPWLFGAWELGRWRMRRKYPLAPKAEAATTGK